MSKPTRLTRIREWWHYTVRDMLRADPRPAAAHLAPDDIAPPDDLIGMTHDDQIDALSAAYTRAVEGR